MSGPFPSVQVLVGFSNGPLDDPASLTTVASPAGSLGASNVWTDVTQYVSSVDIKRGRQHELSAFQAGTCTLEVNNQDGRFNPWNTSSPYNGLILPMKLVQVRAVVNQLTRADASFEGGLGSWTGSGNTTAAVASTQHEDGSFSMSLTAIAAGTVSAQTATGTSAYAVLPGANYSAMGSFRAGATGRAWTVGVSWYNAAGTLLSTSTGSSVTDTTTGWTEGTVAAVAPSTAAFASIVVTGAALGVSEVHYVDEVGLYRAGTVPPWSPGGFGAFPLFTGHVSSWAPKWDDPVSQLAEIQASDAFRFLNESLLSGLQYQNQVKTDGASEFWPFTDPIGSTTAAGAIAGLTGTVVNGTGGQGQALLVTFSGPGTDGPLNLQSTGHIDFGQLTANTTAFTPDCLSLPGIASSGNWSIEFWIKVPTGTTLAPTVFGQNDDLGPPNFTNLAFLSGPPLQLQWIVNNSASVSHACTANFPVDGQWHHIVLSYSSSSMSLYIDGVATTTTGTLGTATLTSGQNTRFGLEASLKTAANVCGGFQGSALAYYPSAALTSTQVNNHYRLGRGFVTGSVSAAVQSILSALGWPAGAENVLASVQQTQTNLASLISTPALQVLQTLERTEEGALFMDGRGRVAFLDRKTLAGGNTAHPEYAQPQVYFGDDIANPATVGTWSSGTGGGTWSSGAGNSTWASMSVRFVPGASMALDDLDIVNQAIVTRVNGVAQVANASSSQTTYGLKSQSVSGALHLTDAASSAHANWIVNKLSATLFRLRSLVSTLVDALGEDTVANTPLSGQTYSRVFQLLGLDLMYRVRTKRVGVGFEQDALVEGIEHKITPGAWDINLALSTTDTYATWGWGGSQ